MGSVLGLGVARKSCYLRVAPRDVLRTPRYFENRAGRSDDADSAVEINRALVIAEFHHGGHAVVTRAQA